jgi:diguanylate cyclase (GGDEF)-like protein/PAS domain S-box-containing protein
VTAAGEGGTVVPADVPAPAPRDAPADRCPDREVGPGHAWDADELAGRWVDAVLRTSYVALPRSELRRRLAAMLDGLLAACRHDDPEAARCWGADAGAALVDAHVTHPQALSRSLAVLLGASRSAGDAVDQRWHERWHEAVAALGAGFSTALQERALVEQEQILLAAGAAEDEAQRALHESQERFRAVFDGARVGIGVGDLTGRVLDVNPELVRMLGYPEEEFRRRGVSDFVHPDDADAVWQLYGQLVRGEVDHFRTEKQFVRATGESVWTDLTVSLLRDPVGEPRYQLALVHDVTALHELRSRLEFDARHDPLTLLGNRKMFLDQLDAFFTGAPDGARAGLCFVDLDGFKAVNDTLGHEVGDQLLLALAGRLQAAVTDRGLEVARLGGDEFVVLAPGSSGPDQLTELAEDLLAAVAEPVHLTSGQAAVTASIGVVERPVAGTEPADLLRAADMALYWAKAEGKSRYAVYEPERGARDVQRYSLSSELPGASARGELRVHYQPMRSLADGSLHGVEALVRWQHPTLGLLAPESFVDLAEQSGVIVPLGRTVLRMACQQGYAWFGARPDGPLTSVNLATQQLRDVHLVDDVRAALAASGLHASQLQLEITESAVIGTDGQTLQALQALSDMGVRLTIDDFGTGYSNLAYLRRLPVDGLKLDGSFLRGLRESAQADPVDVQLVASIVSLAHLLGLTVTAEGVETQAQLQHLGAVGCDVGQGTLFGAAAAVDELGWATGF